MTDAAAMAAAFTRLYPARKVKAVLEVGPARAEPGRPFGLDWMRDYLPHYLTCAPSKLHEELAADLADMDRRRGQKRDLVAPRGSAKSTFLSKGKPLHGALEGSEPLTLLLAETGPQASAYLRSIRSEIESNPAILRDYPHSSGVGPVWQTDRLRLRNGCEIVARGSGGRILGITNGNRRPTLVVVDDGNERGDAYSPTKRRRKIDWLVRDVLPVGEPGTNFFVAGTPIHDEAIVCYLRRNGWDTRSYDAMPTPPSDDGLWRKWSRILFDLSPGAGEAGARAFYEANRGAMDAGAVLLWPERETLSLYALMEYRERYGEQAFRTEYSANPGVAEGAEWPSAYFDKHELWFDDWPEGLTHRVYALDPSKGADSKSGDYQAHAKIGLARDGTIYVECDLRREDVAAMADRAIRQASDFGASEMVVEENGTMGFVVPEFERRMNELKLLVPLRGVTQTVAKMSRIRCVGPYLSRGSIRVRNTAGGRMLVAQWRDVPNGEYDDGPDAAATGITRLQMLVNGRR